MDNQKVYIAIDLKSFYASVECIDRQLNPLTTHLVVADESRSAKTICLAVSPALKAYGIPGRPRLFQVQQQVKEINSLRRFQYGKGQLQGASTDAAMLAQHPEMALDFIAAKPHMARYLAVSGEIYRIYLEYFAPEDIHVYSIDEVFIDASPYLATYGLEAAELASKIILQIEQELGITATAGIGTNLYLAKVAMDILAKHTAPNQAGARIAELDELSYRQKLWHHQPLTDFWRVGRGYAKKLADHQLYTMGDIARCSIGKEADYYNEDLLYKLFGINAQLLIDHAWGWEPCQMQDIKSYRSRQNCLSSGQVLQRPYSFQEGRLVAFEMADALALDLLDKGLVTSQLELVVGYDVENLKPGHEYQGAVKVDLYGRTKPKSAHGSCQLQAATSSSQEICAAILKLYDTYVQTELLVRRFTLIANHVVSHQHVQQSPQPCQQLSLFEQVQPDTKAQAAAQQAQKLQATVLELKHRFGKNSILKGASLQEAATMQQRNNQIGGHHA